MKKYVVIKVYKTMSSTVVASFDEKSNAEKYAELAHLNESGFDFVVAEVL